MNYTLLSTLKAYTALIGAVITGVVGITTPDDPGYKVLTIALAVCTAIATFVVPNQQTANKLMTDNVHDERGEYGGALYIAVIVLVVIVILVLLGFVR